MFDLTHSLATQMAAPTRRQNRQKSGRGPRRQHNGSRNLTCVGGTANLVRSIYNGPDGKDQWNHPVVRIEEKGLSTNPNLTGPVYKAPQGQWLGRVPSV